MIKRNPTRPVKPAPTFAQIRVDSAHDMPATYEIARQLPLQTPVSERGTDLGLAARPRYPRPPAVAASLRSAATRRSTSARVLYMASDGRTVDSSP